MSDFKEFEGKNLDMAIEAACTHFSLGRERLEIEIVSGGSTGIFGLVGAKKATVKARPSDSNSALLDEAKQKSDKKKKPASQNSKKKEETTFIKHDSPLAQDEYEDDNNSYNSNDSYTDNDSSNYNDQQEEREPFGLPDNIEPEVIIAKVREAMCNILRPILDSDDDIEVTLGKDKVLVTIINKEYSGLIIGKGGQTLTSLQYIANRVITRNLGAPVRIQIDTGDYRENQDEKLRELGAHLAEKVLYSGKTLSTRPLSSYHRRIIHLAVQDFDGIITKSKGDGPLKKVLLIRRNTKKDID